MSICKAHYVKTPNALTLIMSGKPVHFQVPPKLYRVYSCITQIISYRSQSVMWPRHRLTPSQTQCPSNDEHVSADEAIRNTYVLHTFETCLLRPRSTNNCHSQKTDLVARLDHITSKLKRETQPPRRLRLCLEPVQTRSRPVPHRSYLCWA